MIFPLGDDNRGRKNFPLINYLLIGLNIFVFIYFQDFGSNEKFIYKFSTVPAEIISGRDIQTRTKTYYDPDSGQKYQVPGLEHTPVPVYLTILTSMFMHANMLHIFGNMLFLFIFGDNVESRIGHLRYLIFYLVCGILAALSNILVTVFLKGNLLIPTLGASGAISGVLGAYLLLFPKNKVLVLFFYFLTEIPAVIAIGAWFLFQLISGLGLLDSSEMGGIAYGAHVGGFIAGMLLIGFFKIGK
jgi:rhomboid family protein